MLAFYQDYNLLLSDDGEENQNTEVEDADNDDEVLALNILSDQEEVDEVQKRAAAMEQAIVSGVGMIDPVTKALRLPCVAHTVCVDNCLSAQMFVTFS